MKEQTILMHISDLHFHRLPLNPLRYVSKRALGATNLILRRRRRFPLQRARALVRLLQKMDWSHLLISGDLTQLGLDEEFFLARQILAPLLAAGPERVTVIPGNHDRYVPESPGRGAFETHFGEFAPQGDFLARELGNNWWLAAWDSAIPAPVFSASGRVRRETLTATGQWISGLPKGAQVIVANHYPLFFPPPHQYHRSHDLLNTDEVRDWLLRQPVRLYLHGHIHSNWVLELAGEKGPLTVINSASSTQKVRPGDPSAFHRILLEKEGFHIEPIRFD